MSVPLTASVSEDGGTVDVCATLSVTGSIAGDIDITLTPNDGKCQANELTDSFHLFMAQL